jgi:hypothetical protein
VLCMGGSARHGVARVSARVAGASACKFHLLRFLHMLLFALFIGECLYRNEIGRRERMLNVNLSHCR